MRYIKIITDITKIKYLMIKFKFLLEIKIIELKYKMTITKFISPKMPSR